MRKVFSLIMSLLTPIINGVLERCLKGLVTWEHNTSDDATATRLMYGVFQTQVHSLLREGVAIKQAAFHAIRSHE